jgi:hypothetical protein
MTFKAFYTSLRDSPSEKCVQEDFWLSFRLVA